jgi:hypothetical protein
VGYFPRLIAHKLNVLLYVLDVFNIFFSGISIIKTKIALSSFVDLGLHKVESHSFAVSNMQITVGLWWETSQNNISEFTDLILDEFFGIQS